MFSKKGQKNKMITLDVFQTTALETALLSPAREKYVKTHCLDCCGALFPNTK